MDYSTKITSNLKNALGIANQFTLNANASYVGSEHLVYAFLQMPNCAAYKILVSEGVSKDEYDNVFVRSINPNTTSNGLTARTKEMFVKAIKFAETEKTGILAGTAHFLYAVLDSESCFAVKILKRLGADIPSLKRKTERRIIEEINKKAIGYTDDAPSYSQSTENRFEENEQIKKSQAKVENYGFSSRKAEQPEEKSSQDKMLSYGIDLTERARRGKLDPVIGREKETEEVIQVLSRRSKNNPVLVGEPGVGKSAILEGLAQLIVSGNVPEQLYNKTIFSVDMAGMISGAKYRGEFEERLKDLVNTVMQDGDTILFIDEIHNIVGAGSTADGSMDAANILKPLLARGDLQVIGATTIDEYRKYIEKDAALVRRFTQVDVCEPSVEATQGILKGLRKKYEEHHGLIISDEAIEAAVKLSVRYITDRYLPDKAIDLIDEASSRARIISKDGGEEMVSLRAEYDEITKKRQFHLSRGEYKEATELLEEQKEVEERIKGVMRANSMEKAPDGRYILGKDQIATIVAARTKIPLLKISQEESEKLLNLENELHHRIVGQNEAVSAVAKAIRRARAGLKDPSRPIGSFIFVGPTGVGKTDLCKALAQSMFGSEDQMIRLDMSEYMEKQSISKIIGAAPGYAGYDDLQTGQLTDKVRTKPYCVILFDEIEKAHPDVFNLLLQILDDGRLTDNKGRTVSFKNAVIILTSNTGANEADVNTSGVYGFGGSLQTRNDSTDNKAYEEMKERITESLKERFKPEFLNRLDEVIVFHKLTKENASKIAEKLIDGLARRLLEQRGIELSVATPALYAIVEEGYDSKYGARPLKRVIQRRIEDKLSEDILLGKHKNGEKITVDYVNGEYVFS